MKSKCLYNYWFQSRSQSFSLCVVLCYILYVLFLCLCSVYYCISVLLLSVHYHTFLYHVNVVPVSY